MRPDRISRTLEIMQAQGHWHVDLATHHAMFVLGEVGECCEPFATYDDLFGPDRSHQEAPRDA